MAGTAAPTSLPAGAAGGSRGQGLPGAGGQSAVNFRAGFPPTLWQTAVSYTSFAISVSVFHSFLSVKTTQNKASLLKMP